MALKNINTYIILTTLFLGLFGCTKQTEQDLFEGGETKLVFKSTQIVNVIEKNRNTSKASAISHFKQKLGFSTEAYAAQTAIEAPSNLNPISRAIGPTSPMTPTYTYRVLLYNKQTNKLVTTKLAKSGESFTIDVPKGEKFVWYAYSYNDDKAIPEPKDIENPSIEMSIEKDFLYDSGEVETLSTPIGELNTYPIDLVFHHMVTQVSVKIDATSLAQVSTIDNIKVSFDRNDYLKKGNFSLKNGIVENIEVVPTDVIFNTPNTSNIWEKSFYTADPNNLTEYQIIIDDLETNFFMADPAYSKINLATINPNNQPKFIFKFASPITTGQQLTGIANLTYTLQSRRIFHISNNTNFGYSLQLGPGWRMINSSKNFGNTPESLVKMHPYAPGQGVWIGGSATNNLTNWTNTNTAGQRELLSQLNDKVNRPDIVISAYNQSSFNTDLQDAIVNFVNEGGVFIMFNEFTSSTISSLLNKIFDTNSISLRNLTAAGSMYPLLQTEDTDRVLNGPFGDARGKLWGEDASTSVGVLGLPQNNTIIYSYGQAINRSHSAPNASTVSMFKHKTKNFFYLGDGGLVSYNGGTSDIICPFDFDPVTERPIPKLYGNGGQGYVSRSDYAYNGIIAGNIMLWAAAIAEFSGLRPWKYAP